MDSKKIKLLSRFLFFLAFLLIFYVLFIMFSNEKIVTEALHKNKPLFKNVKFSSNDSNKNSIVFHTDIINKNNESITADNSFADIQFKDMCISVKSDFIEGTKDECNFTGNVSIHISNAIKLNTASINANFKSKILKSDKKIHITRDNMHAYADRSIVNFNENSVSLSGNVQIISPEYTLECNQLIGKFKKAGSEYIFQDATAEGNIKYFSKLHKVSAKNKVKINQKMITFSGDVCVRGVANKNPYKISSNEIDVILNENNSLNKVICKNKFIFITNNNTITGECGVLHEKKVSIIGKVSIKTPSGVIDGTGVEYDIATGKCKINNPNGVFFKNKL